MVIAAAATALLIIVWFERHTQGAPPKPPLHSPLSLRAVLAFGSLFLSLTVVSGLGQRFFGTVGFLAAVIVGAFASTASSAVLVGGHLHLIGGGAAALAMFFATVMGLAENVVIFSTVTRDRPLGVRFALLSLPIALLGAFALALVLLLG